MGQSQSNRTFFKLHTVMPPVNRNGNDNPLTGWLDKSAKPFVSNDDRNQFLYATITVVTENGAIDLRDHDFRLLYSRRNNNAERLVARLVAEKDGVIRTQVVANEDGKNQIDAFLAFRKHVEMELDSILSGLPNVTASGSMAPYEDGRGQTAGASSSTARPSASASPIDARQSAMATSQSRSDGSVLPSDAPPAYGKAVKDWKADEKKR